jgi:multimeric flavodoxin WrbA
MRVLAINGSPRKGGNTQVMIEQAAKALERCGVEVEQLSLRGYDVRPCNACEVCSSRPWKCPIKDDALEVLKKMRDVDGLLIASPVYGADVTAQLKALLDRSIIPYVNQDFRDKVGGAISVGGGSHGGQEFAILQILSFFAFQGMIVANPKGGLFGAMGTANDRGDIRKDKEGLRSARELGERMAELLERMAR